MAQPVTGTIDLATAMNNPRDAYANLLRSQHEEWVKDFQPLEQNLIGMTTYNGNKGIADGIIANQSAAPGKFGGPLIALADKLFGHFGLYQYSVVNSAWTEAQFADYPAAYRRRIRPQFLGLARAQCRCL